MKQLDALGLASISQQIRLGGELCMHSRAPKASHDRMRRQWRRALLFNRLLLFHCHCNVIKCVSPCQKDLNLPGGFYCLIQHKFPGWRSKENRNDLISEISLASIPSSHPYYLSFYSLLPAFFPYLQNPKSTSKSILQIRLLQRLNPQQLQSDCRWQRLVLTGPSFSFSYFARQVWPRPRDLLVRFHRRAGLPEGQRHPVERLLPHRHRHPVPRQPTGPAIAGAQMKGE